MHLTEKCLWEKDHFSEISFIKLVSISHNTFNDARTDTLKKHEYKHFQLVEFNHVTLLLPERSQKEEESTENMKKQIGCRWAFLIYLTFKMINYYHYHYGFHTGRQTLLIIWSR
jgi:hypothetical protein